MGVRPALVRRVEQGLIGGFPRSSFESDVLAFVGAVTELAGRLDRRGWTDMSSGPDLNWDWAETALPEDAWDGPDGSRLQPSTSISVYSIDGDGADQLAVEVTLVGELDTWGADRSVRPEQLTDIVLAELEAYQAGQASPMLPVVGRAE